MMKIFKTEQTKVLDAYTIKHEPITSFNLMGRAVKALFEAILPLLDRDKLVVIVAGPGNNGGDALVLAKLLTLIRQPLQVNLFHNGKISEDCNMAKSQLQKQGTGVIENNWALTIPNEAIVIDGLFGAGLSRPLANEYADLVNRINLSGAETWSIDIPSGLMGEQNEYEGASIIKAARTFTFQQPKLSFFFSENSKYIGELQTLDIGLHPQAISDTDTNFFLVEPKDIKLNKRPPFSHKGTFGHALLIAGKYGMAGAAVLSSRSCMRMGVGLLTTHIPSQLYNIIQLSIPEAIVSLDENSQNFSHVKDINRYSAIGIGPGQGVEEVSYEGFREILEANTDHIPMVIDADALNIISAHKDLLEKLPADTIITPHPKEFDRICGPSANAYQRMLKGIELAKQYSIIVIIKGAYSNIIFPNGEVYFNCTGNPGMATAGSGDVLTGIILSLLAQHYPAKEAAIMGAYIHGKAGDHAAEAISQEAMLASDIIAYLPATLKEIERL